MGLTGKPDSLPLCLLLPQQTWGALRPFPLSPDDSVRLASFLFCTQKPRIGEAAVSARKLLFQARCWEKVDSGYNQQHILMDSTNLSSEDLMTAPSRQINVTNYHLVDLPSLIIPGIWELPGVSSLTWEKGSGLNAQEGVCGGEMSGCLDLEKMMHKKRNTEAETRGLFRVCFPRDSGLSQEEGQPQDPNQPEAW